MSRASVLRMLEDIGPMTSKELALLHALAVGTTDRTLRSLHRDGYVRIKSWEHPPKGRPAALWAIGEGEDAPRPGRIPKEVKNARHYARKKMLQARQQAGVWGGLL